MAPDAFAEHLDTIVASGATTMTVSSFVDRLKSGTLPEHPALVTFDDGFADIRDTALPQLLQRGMTCTVYVTTGFMEAAQGPQGEAMLDRQAVCELAMGGCEIGAHSHTHPQLDTLTTARAKSEITVSKALLEDTVAMRVRSFAYPHGYSSGSVRRQVHEAGFDSACAVGNAFSHEMDDVLRLSRLMMRSTTTAEHVAAWLEGSGARLAPAKEQARTRAWRIYRRLGRLSRLSSGSVLPTR
jgi:peptidoglycan/xylan/chitin deacetylase (PgdA/CDA1 family)